MRSRLAAVILLLAGLTLCLVTLSQHTVPAAGPFSRVVHDVAPVMTQASVDQLRADLRVVDAGATGLSTQALPALAAATGQTPAQLQAGLVTSYPQVATGLGQLPAITAAFNGFADLIEAQQSNFASVADIPVDGVEPTAIPPALLGLGGVLVLLGLGLLLKPRSAGIPRAAVALGVVVVITCLVTALPHKAGDSAQLKSALGPVLTRTAVDADKADLKVMTDMSAQLQSQLLPDTAKALGVTPEQLAGQLVSASPAVGTLFQQLAPIQGRFDQLVRLLEANLAPWQLASQPSLVVLIRVLLACALASFAAGALALTGRRSRSVVGLRALPAQPQALPLPRSAAEQELAADLTLGG